MKKILTCVTAVVLFFMLCVPVMAKKNDSTTIPFSGRTLTFYGSWTMDINIINGTRYFCDDGLGSATIVSMEECNNMVFDNLVENSELYAGTFLSIAEDISVGDSWLTTIDGCKAIAIPFDFTYEGYDAEGRIYGLLDKQNDQSVIIMVGYITEVETDYMEKFDDIIIGVEK